MQCWVKLQVRRTKLRGWRETNAPLAQHDSVPSGLLLLTPSGSFKQHVLATKDLQCHVGDLSVIHWQHWITACLGHWRRVSGKAPCRQTRMNTCMHLPETYGEFHMLAELMQLREEGGLIVLEGCCTPRGHVLEQFMPQAIERAEYVFSAAIACFPEWQASLIICVSVVDRLCKCVPHRCASACVCQSAYVCAFALVYASASMYKSCFLLRAKSCQRWNLLLPFQPLSSLFDAPRCAGFWLTHQPSQKAAPAALGKAGNSQWPQFLSCSPSWLFGGKSQACGGRSKPRNATDPVSLPRPTLTPSARQGHPEVQVLWPRPCVWLGGLFFSGGKSYAEEEAEVWTHYILQALFSFFN